MPVDTSETRSPSLSSPTGASCLPLSSDKILEKTWQGLCKKFKKISFLKLNYDQIKGTIQAYGSLSDDHITLNLEFEPWNSSLVTLSLLDEVSLKYILTLSDINNDLLDMHVKRKAALYFGVYPALISGMIKFIHSDILGGSILLYLMVFGVGGLMFLNFYQAKWRASELGACIKMALARAKLMTAQPAAGVQNS